MILGAFSPSSCLRSRENYFEGYGIKASTKHCIEAILGFPALSHLASFGYHLMRLPFTKMNGAGNDFILIDNRKQSWKLSTLQIARLCDRHAGIGADGLMLLEPPLSDQAQWSWQFYNSDGSAAEMCGNGARCFAAFAKGLCPAESVSFDTLAGVIRAEFLGEEVCVDLTPPGPMTMHQHLLVDGKSIVVHSVNTGVPHAVVEVEELASVDVMKLGSLIRYHADFAPKGTNVNFVQKIAPERIRVRTYERGVEGETLACGTGVSACALVMASLHGMPSPIGVEVKSGDKLKVSFETHELGYARLRLTGPAVVAFTGEVELD